MGAALLAAGYAVYAVNPLQAAQYRETLRASCPSPACDRCSAPGCSANPATPLRRRQGAQELRR